MVTKKRNYKHRTKTPNRNSIQSESSHAGSENEHFVPIEDTSFTKCTFFSSAIALIALFPSKIYELLISPDYSTGAFAFLFVLFLLLLLFIIFIYRAVKTKLEDRDKYHLTDVQCKNSILRRNVICSLLIFCCYFVALPLLTCATTRTHHMLVTVFPSAVSDSNADQGENGTNTITVTPTPSPEQAPSAAAIATYTPIPKDECQQSFDRLWSFYMADFINNGPHNLEDAEATSDALIDSIWLTTNTDSIGWNYEQMDLYSDSAYATALQDEQYLRQNSTAENKLIAAKEYVSATNTQIAQKSDSDNFQERDLGLAALRGVNLLSDYLSPSRPNAKDSADQENSALTSGLQVGVAYNNMALLLRHFADNLYTDYESNIDSQKCQYALCVFSYACYKRAKSNGYNSQSIENDIAEMKKSMELVYPY